VIGIVAVLMSILLPSLGRARAASARVACASQMRQIILGAANYAAANKGSLPPYVGYPGDYSVSNSYNKDNLKPLFDSKMLTTDKIRYCPNGPRGELFGGRANYQFNPHVVGHAQLAGKSTWRYRKFQQLPKDRMLIMDVLYDKPNVSHWDTKGNASWNVGFTDGHVNIVPQNDVYNMLSGRPGNTWGRLSDYVRVLELQATGQDPKLGTGQYQWAKYDVTTETANP
jgi:hypothetical protein